MTGQQHFQDVFDAWILALSFIILVIIIAFVWLNIYAGDFKNPLAPFIRAYEVRQRHRHQMELLKLKASFAYKGLDPAYVKFMEDELNNEIKESKGSE